MTRRDAQRLPVPGPDAERIRPRHAQIWLRLEGRWLAGTIRDWYRTEAGWAIWVQHDRPDGKPWPDFGAFLYEPETVRERRPGSPPPAEPHSD